MPELRAFFTRGAERKRSLAGPLASRPALELDAADQARAHHHQQEFSAGAIAAAQDRALVALVDAWNVLERVFVLRKIAARDPAHVDELAVDRHVHAMIAARRQEDHREAPAVVVGQIEIVEPGVDHAFEAQALAFDDQRTLERKLAQREQLAVGRSDQTGAQRPRPWPEPAQKEVVERFEAPGF